MNTAVKCQPKNLMLGDVMLIGQHTWTIIDIEGPDKIGTYDLRLHDSFDNYRYEFVTEPVTILM